MIIAPDATDEAREIIAGKKNLRLLLAGGLPARAAPGMTVKSVAGGLLVQSRDNATVDEMQLKTVTKRAPTAAELDDLRFAFRVAKHVKSNTIVYAKALACDPTSAFGGIVALNRTLDAEAARAITEIFTEVIIAPDASEEAIAIVGAKKNLRLLLAGCPPDPRAAGLGSNSATHS